LVGRDPELQRLYGLIRGRVGAVLAGPTGVGKTAVGRACADFAMAQGMSVVHVTATSATCSLRFGVFAPYLPVQHGLARDPMDEATLLRLVASELTDRGSDAGLLLLVDDAQHLDDASATVVHQLAETRAAVVVVAARSGISAPGPVVALWKDGLVERLELGVLDRTQIDTLLQAVLGGPVDPIAVRQLADRSGGNPLFLRELVIGALDSGDLFWGEGVWRVAESMRPSLRLVELVEQRLGHLASEEREFLELLSLNEPCGRAELAALADPAVIESLERKAVITSRLDGRRLQVWPAHPLFGEVARGWLSPLGQLDLLQRRVEVLESLGMRRREDPLLVASWRLVVGGGQADVLEAGALAARARADPELTWRLATAAAEAGAGFTARFTAAEAAFLLGDAARVEGQLAHLRPRAKTDAERARVVTLEADTDLFLLGRADPSALAEAERTISDPHWQREILSRRMSLIYATEGVDALVRAAEPLLTEPGPAGASFGHLLGCFGLAGQGRIGDALELLSRTAEELTDQTTSGPWYEGTRRHFHSQALVNAGRLGEAEAELMDAYERALSEGNTELRAFMASGLSNVRLAQGRVRAASLLAKEASQLFQMLHRDGLARMPLVVDAMASALSGDPAAAATCLATIDSVIVIPVRAENNLFEPRAWIAAAAGDLPAARELLETAATDAEQTGNLTQAISALHGVARLGQARHVRDRVAALAARMEGDLVRARFAHVDALSADNIDELELAGRLFEELGANLLAAEAFADAAAAHRRRGEARAGAAAAQRAAILASRCEGAMTPALRGLGSRTKLARSELDTARLAAAGHSNRAIAERLDVSVRTVENRLQRVYEKLGVPGRQELATAIDQLDDASQ
jgi:DNA-binding CsgD family transcriptional regulator